MAAPLSQITRLRVSVTRNKRIMWKMMCSSTTSSSSSGQKPTVGSQAQGRDDMSSFVNGKDRLGHIMQMYEDLVGLTEVKTAQDKVVDAERNFLKVQDDRRNLQQELAVVQNEVRSVAAELEKLHRTDPSYVDLVKKEHGILVVEQNMAEKLKVLDKSERDLFSLLSACVRESHEKERARAERTKYWSIIGSVIGAVIGITGSAINNHKRIKELRDLIQESGQNTAEYKDIVDKVIASMTSASRIQQESCNDNNNNNNNNNNNVAISGSEKRDIFMDVDKLQQKNEFFFQDLKAQTAEILTQMNEVQKMVASLQSSDLSGNVVYVGPEMKSMLLETEARFEKAANKNLVKSMWAVGGVGMVTLGVVLFNFIFKGS